MSHTTVIPPVMTGVTCITAPAGYISLRSNMGTNVPEISVYMSVYDGERYVGDAIRSILSQTFTNFEFIIVDDGSTDSTPAILQSYADEDPRVRIKRQANAGAWVAQQLAWQLTRGKLCAKMDADDVADQTRLEKQLAFLRSNPEVVAVGSSVTLIDPDGWPITAHMAPQTHEEIERLLLSGRTSITHPTLMVRRTAMEKVGGYDASYVAAEDIDLFIRLAEIGKLANLPDILLSYRQHPGSIGYRMRAKQQEQCMRAAAAGRARRGLPPMDCAPSGRNMSAADCHLRWARWAIKGGNGATARKHALTALALKPWSPRALQLTVASLFA